MSKTLRAFQQYVQQSRDKFASMPDVNTPKGASKLTIRQWLQVLSLGTKDYLRTFSSEQTEQELAKLKDKDAKFRGEVEDKALSMVERAEKVATRSLKRGLRETFSRKEEVKELAPTMKGFVAVYISTARDCLREFKSGYTEAKERVLVAENYQEAAGVDKVERLVRDLGQTLGDKLNDFLKSAEEFSREDREERQERLRREEEREKQGLPRQEPKKPLKEIVGDLERSAREVADILETEGKKSGHAAMQKLRDTANQEGVDLAKTIQKAREKAAEKGVDISGLKWLESQLMAEQGPQGSQSKPTRTENTKTTATRTVNTSGNARRHTKKR